MTPEEAKKIAHEVHQWVENACGDLAYQVDFADIEYSFGKTIANKAKKMKRDRMDWKGWLADEIYNNHRHLSDMVGDHLYDSARNDLDRIEVAKQLVGISHPALAKAVRGFIRRRKEDIKNRKEA